MSKTLAIFASSEDLPEHFNPKKIEQELTELFCSIQDKIDKIIFGGSQKGAMGITFRAATEAGIHIEGYTIPQYVNKKYNPGNFSYNNGKLKTKLDGNPTSVFMDIDARLKAFHKDADIFLALPGAIGTLEEVLTMNTRIKKDNIGKKILVHPSYQLLIDVIHTLEKDKMIAPEDTGIIQISRNMEELTAKLSSQL